MILNSLGFFQKAFLFNLLMIPVSLLLYIWQDKDAHLYMTFIWSGASLVGFFISERIMRDHPHSK